MRDRPRPNTPDLPALVALCTSFQCDENIALSGMELTQMIRLMEKNNNTPAQSIGELPVKKITLILSGHEAQSNQCLYPWFDRA